MTVGPAQTTTCDLAATQVNTFDARRVDEDLEHRARLRHVRNAARVELEADVVLGLTIFCRLEEVGTQRRHHQVDVATQQPVVVQAGDLVEQTIDALAAGVDVILATLTLRVEAQIEQLHQLAGDIRMAAQRIGDVGLGETEADLLQVARVGTQHRHFTPVQARADDQAVEGIGFGFAGPDLLEGFDEALAHFGELDRAFAVMLEIEIVHPAGGIGAGDLVGTLTDDTQAEVFQHRQHVGKRNRLMLVEQLQVDAGVVVLDQTIGAQADGLAFVQRA